MKKTPKIELIELRTGKTLRQAMIDAYIKTGNTFTAAAELDITHTSYDSWRKQVHPPLTLAVLRAAREAARVVL